MVCYVMIELKKDVEYIGDDTDGKGRTSFHKSGEETSGAPR